jgi:molybdopterin converting factor small subunit
MEIKFKFIGTIKFAVGGKSELTLDLPENCTVEEALRTLGVDCKESTQFHFAVVDGEKVEPEYALKPGDYVKVFSRSFGG